MTLPDCPFCEDSTTLHAERAEPRGVKVCVCIRCSRQMRVNANGAIVRIVEPRVENQEGGAVN